MLLVLGDDGANLNIPDLLPQRLLVTSANGSSTEETMSRWPV
jgi:hypothetical protein